MLMSANSVLIFGAGINQFTMIQAAKSLGVESVVLDVTEDAPGRALADHFYCVAGNDYATTREIALRHQVKGLVTSQMEKPMRLMAKLAAELGLRFHTPEVTARSLDKWLMKAAFQRGNVPCAKGVLIEPGAALPEAQVAAMGFPLIIKPKDATSSQGVFRVESLSQAQRLLETTRSYSKSREVIVEEFLDGPEFSVEAITYEGKTTIVQITEKFLYSFPCPVEIGHLQPAPVSLEQHTAISEATVAAIHAIGIDNSASHAEVKWTREGAKLVEIGARLGGDFISSYLTQASCGIDMDRAAIQAALGQSPDLEPTKQQYAYIKYLELPVGSLITAVADYEDVLSAPEVVYAHLGMAPGTIVPKITESKKRPGFVIVKGESRAQVLELAQQYEQKLVAKFALEQEALTSSEG